MDDGWFRRVLVAGALFALVILAGMLAGCAATAPVEVSVPVPVPCVAAADLPQRPQVTDAAVLRELPDGRLVLTLAGERAALAAYAERAGPLLEGCAR